MLHHVSVGVGDVARAAKFYDAVLGALGYKRVVEYLPYSIGYGVDRPEFWIGPPHDGKPMSVGNGTHLGFIARSKAQVHKFHEAALRQGGSNNGEPGPRPDYGPDYYGAFVYDLDGNKIEATLHVAPKAQSAKKPMKKATARPVKKAAKAPVKKKEESETLSSPDVVRCGWSVKEPIYIAYHDEEWGVPEYDARALYEKLVLDGFQAGLSWLTILKKRENFRAAFDNFDPQKMARYGKREVNRLMKDAGIVRSEAKIAAAIRGAQLWLDIEEKEPGGFTQFLWKHVEGKPKVNRYKTLKQVPPKTKMSEGLARELKSRGFNFCGPVIVYAFAQAVGMVNDHIVSCHRHAPCSAMAEKH